MKRWATLLVAALLLTLPISVSAQGGGASSTGSISGQVVDDGGGALPGVIVKATSPAQIGTLTAVTNEEGIYRFPAVAPGEYRLEFALAGFRTLVREGIRVDAWIKCGRGRHARRRERAGNRHRLRRVSGRRPVDHAASDQLRPRDACVAAERPGHVVAARRNAIDRSREGRCRRQHRRHADELLCLRILRSEPSAHRRDQHDGGNLGGRFLSRLRLVRGSVHRRGR